MLCIVAARRGPATCHLAALRLLKTVLLMSASLTIAIAAVVVAILATLLIIRVKKHPRPPKMVQAILSREEYARILLDNPDPVLRHAALSNALAPEHREDPQDVVEKPPTEATDTPEAETDTHAVLSRQQRRQNKRAATATKEPSKVGPEPFEPGQEEPESPELTKEQRKQLRRDVHAAKREDALTRRAARRAEKVSAKAARKASNDATAASEIVEEANRAGILSEPLVDPYTTGPNPSQKTRRPWFRRQKRTRHAEPEFYEVTAHPQDSAVPEHYDVFTDDPEFLGELPAPETQDSAPTSHATLRPRRRKDSEDPAIYVPEDSPSTLEQDEYNVTPSVDFDQALEDLLETEREPLAYPLSSDERFITKDEAESPDVLAPPELTPPPGRRSHKTKNTTTAEHVVDGIDPSELRKASKEAALIARQQTKEAREARAREAKAQKSLRREALRRDRGGEKRRRAAVREAAKVERAARLEEKRILRRAKGDERTVTTEGSDGIVVTMSEKDFRGLERERKRLQRIAIVDARKAERDAKKNRPSDTVTENTENPEVAPSLQEHTLAEPEHAPQAGRAQKRESLRAMRAITRAEHASVREGARIERKRKAEDRQRSKALSQLTQMQSGKRTPARLRAIERRARKLGMDQSSDAPRYHFDQETGEIVYVGDSHSAATRVSTLRYDWRAAGLPEPLPERTH